MIANDKTVHQSPRKTRVTNRHSNHYKFTASLLHIDCLLKAVQTVENMYSIETIHFTTYLLPTK